MTPCRDCLAKFGLVEMEHVGLSVCVN